MAKTIHRAEYDTLRDLLREKRVDRGLTQVDVSQRLGRSQSFVSDVERGMRRIDVLELRDLCELYGVQLTAFCKEFERRAAAVASVGKRPARLRNHDTTVRSRERASMPRATTSRRKAPSR